MSQQSEISQPPSVAYQPAACSCRTEGGRRRHSRETRSQARHSHLGRACITASSSSSKFKSATWQRTHAYLLQKYQEGTKVTRAGHSQEVRQVLREVRQTLHDRCGRQIALQQPVIQRLLPVQRRRRWRRRRLRLFLDVGGFIIRRGRALMGEDGFAGSVGDLGARAAAGVVLVGEEVPGKRLVIEEPA
jgi:hypothetical protein